LITAFNNITLASYTITQIAAMVGGVVGGQQPLDKPLMYLSTDSRKIAFPEATVFFALEGPHRSGHQFLSSAYALGVRHFLVNQAPLPTGLPDATFLVVPNSLRALQRLAAAHRASFQLPVIGITGSYGKTVVKEWLYQLLHPHFNIVRSPKSFNSQIGVPLSVWEIEPTHNLGIFEAGISLSGEMEILAEIIQPTIGILTNIGSPHAEGFTSQQQKLEEKANLFRKCNVVFARWQDWQALNPREADPATQWLTIGTEAESTFVVSALRQLGSETKVDLTYQSRTQNLLLPFTNPAQIENALMCAAVAWWLNMPLTNMQQALRQLYPVDMRLQWKRGINHCQLLNDGYTSDLPSLKIALDYLAQQKQGEKLTLILSDFSEPTGSSSAFYAQVVHLVGQYSIYRLVAVGPRLAEAIQPLVASGVRVHSFYNTQTAIDAMPSLQLSHENILIKGARVFGFETLVQALQQQAHETELAINLAVVAQRLNFYRSMLQPTTKIMVMLKAFGYGSGDVEIARLLQFSGVDYLAVAYTDEGVTLRKAGIHLPIMVMNPETAGFALLERYNLEPELYDFGILGQFLDWCRQQGTEHFPVHIKLDTGMHRLGFLPEAVGELEAILAGQSTLVVKSVFTHLVAAEDAAEDDYTTQQAERFHAAANRLEAALGYHFIRHLANTAGISRHPTLHAHMVRLGIGLYAGGRAGLPAALSLTTRIAQLKWVPAGQTVGYGRAAKMAANTRVATVRIGYADGYRRQFGQGNGYMLVRGQPATVLGKVCMDMTMLDVTHIEGAAVGDAVEVFGHNLPLEVLAQQCGTIIYEIITGIGQRVKRVYLSE